MTRRRRSSRGHRGAAVAAAIAAAGLAPLEGAGAQATTATTACVASPADRPAGSWPAPLDRAVELRADGATLGAALERVAIQARLRLSFSPDLLAVGRPACGASRRLAAGDALAALLRGTGLAPVVAGGDLVVLAPAAAAAGTPSPGMARGTATLERVVVTGTAMGAPQRASPLGLVVVEPRAGERQGAMSMSQLLDGAVPGVWLWTQAPTSVLARWGSVRGASSFGVSSPKVYVDGIEIANPLLLSAIDPARVQRVEVIRGPQGAALYGADAIAGVVNVVTRQGGAGGGVSAEARPGAGTADSRFAAGPVVMQDHGATVAAGSSALGGALGLTVSSVGAYVPGASSRQAALHAGARRLGTRTMLTGTARFHAQDVRAPRSPLLDGVALPESAPVPQSLRQYTLGASGTLLASERWTHAATAGIDGYRLAGFSDEGVPVLSAADSALRAARGGADRATLRLSSTGRAGDPARRAATLTLGLEHSTAREHTEGVGVRMAERLRLDEGVGAETTWWSSTGALAQGQLAWGGAAFLTGGARVERVGGPGVGPSVELLPMLGASLVHQQGPGALKLRAAYGRGIRPARTVARGATFSGGSGRRGGGTREGVTALAPESQGGVEVGADLLFGRRFGLHVTRFDQRASGLVQPVAVIDSSRLRRGSGGSGSGGDDSGPGSGGDRLRLLAYQLQNVGAIDNTGWELQASAAAGPLALGATLSLVESRVARLAVGYRGDLRTGDRMLEVPARTMGVTADWTGSRLTLGATIARAEDWINYGRRDLATALAAAYDEDGELDEDLLATMVPVGARLREYWRRYPGVTRVGARGSLRLWRGATVLVTGENLLGRQTGEPDDVTVVPGRGVTVGVRVGDGRR